MAAAYAHSGAAIGPHGAGGIGPGSMHGMGSPMMHGGFGGPMAAQQLITPEERQAMLLGPEVLKQAHPDVYRKIRSSYEKWAGWRKSHRVTRTSVSQHW